jgi:cytoplasmic iron level regulating protein YaaA (DUF328/UPF0246 family)
LLTLLSPAKSLDFSPVREGLPLTEPRFEHDIEVLMKRCKKLSVSSLRKLMNLSQPLAELNRERFQEMSLPFTPENARPCVLAFQGDVYKGLDAGSLNKHDLKYAQNHLRILSGLYGVLRPLDLIQPYRLEMGTRLTTSRGKNLYAFWKSRLVDSINQEHARRPVALEPRLVTAVFQEIRNGQPKTISFLAKRARGLMARYQVKNRVEDPERLKDFSEEGYEFRPDLSEEDRLVFTRDRS